MTKKRPFIEGVIVGVVITFFLSAVITRLNAQPAYSMGGAERAVSEEFDQKTQAILNLIDKYFVGEYDIKDLEESMYLGLVYGLGDRYSSYMNRETFQDFKERSEGVLVGIGAQVQLNPNGGGVLVVNPFEGAPAFNSGVKAGDIVTHVNETDITAFDLEVAVSMIRGEEGSTATLRLIRDGEVLEIDVVRAKFDVPTVNHRVLEDNIGYIMITGFDGVTFNQFKDALNSLKQENVKGLIIDVRNNPGGLLSTVYEICNLILPEGIITYTEDKNGHKEYLHSKGDYVDLPIVVLINEYSASASEILAGAIQDYERGTLVGNQTFGKGVVQRIFELTDESAVKLTVSRYYTPNGISIHGEGVTPDYIVPMEESLTFRISSIELEEDVQLKKAIELIGEKISLR